MKIPNGPIGYRNRDLPACSATTNEFCIGSCKEPLEVPAAAFKFIVKNYENLKRKICSYKHYKGIEEMEV
jgi:hypothetical protein